MKKIVITGPESTGKSTLASQLAEHFKVPFVPEYSRTYLNNIDRPYQEEDLLQIAKGQLDYHNDPSYQGQDLQICDTGFLVLKIWSEYKYGRCHPWILDQFHNHPPDLYLLCDIDFPWTFDPLRENPDDRAELMAIYRRELQWSGFNYVEIKGSPAERLWLAVGAVNG